MKTNLNLNPQISWIFKSLFLALILFTKPALAQLECFTPDNTSGPAVSQPPSCTDYVYYEPDPTNNYQNTPVLTYKVNFHFFRKSDGTGVLQPTPAFIGQMYDFVNITTNSIYEVINPPTLPVTPPAQYINDSRVRFILTNVYFHDDDNYYFGTELCGPTYYNAWGVNKCSEINVFWYFTAPGYGGCGPYGYINFRMDPNGMSGAFSWAWAQVFAHELGHSAGYLPHTWSDSFTDTFWPDNNLAWASCNTTNISNNIMGYNTCRDYLSPMQMGWYHMYANSAFPNYNTTKFLTYCDYDAANSITVNTTQTWITSKAVGGDITVTSGNTLTIQCNVFMPLGGKIYVQPGAHLIIDGGKVSNACCAMWDGVYLDGPTALLTMQNSAIIELAVNAVYTTNGGVFQIQNSTLRDNYNHIHLEGVAAAYPGYIRSSVLSCPNGLQNPYPVGSKTYNPIEIRNCTLVTIGDDANAGFTNIIKDFTNFGIQVQNSDAAIINNDISTTASTAATGVYAINQSGGKYLYVGTTPGGANPNSVNTFHDLNRGVYAINGITPIIFVNDFNNIGYKAILARQCYKQISIYGNLIHNSPTIFIGIHTANNPRTTSISIDNNTENLHEDATGIKDEEPVLMDFPQVRITNNQIFTVRRGIWVVGDATPLIMTNRIEFNIPPSNNLYGNGILVQNCYKPDIEQQNFVYSTTTQIPFRGIVVETSTAPYICSNTTDNLERGILCRTTMFGTKVKLNTMSNCINGFVLGNVGNIGEQGDAAANEVSDNRWINNTWDTYSVGGSNLNPLGNTFFDVRHVPNYFINTFHNDLLSYKVIDNIISNPANNADCADHTGWRPQHALVQAITDTTGNDTTLTYEERWIGDKATYELATRDTAIDTTDQVISDYIDDMETTPIGQFSQVESHVSAAFSDTITFETDTAEIDEARGRNDQIDNSEMIDYYKRIALEIYLQTLAREIYVFNEYQENWILFIAPLCPFEAGPAVYTMRTLYHYLDETVEFFDDDCDESAGFRNALINDNSSSSSSSGDQFIIYPNPASKELNIDYVISKESKSLFEISDLAGRKVYSKILNGSEHHVSLKIDHLGAGTYYYKVYNNNQVVKNDKLIIIK